METVFILLGIVGIATAAWHLVRAAFGFLRQSAAGIWAGEMSQTYAQRGDLTALHESEKERSRATRSGARSGLLALGWGAALVVPAFTAWAKVIYAAYALLLIEPAIRRVRR